MTKKFISSILRPIRTQLFRYQWRRRNKHNNTYAINCFHAENVSVGKKTYGPIEVLYDNGFGSLSVGNYCSIAREVKFFLGGEHDYRRISTYPFQTLTYQVINGGGRLLDIKVEDDVWIGYDCIILSGSVIGKGSVIGARSVVKGTIPPYSVYVGNKVIKRRFPDELINKIEGIDFSKIKHAKGDFYQQYCSSIVNDNNIEEVIDAFVK